MFYTAFFMGLLGSLHCIGMCGPLTLLLPQKASSKLRFLLGRSIYNLARISVYGLLGFLIGLFGEQLTLFFSQNLLSVLIGLIILVFLFLPNRVVARLDASPPIARFTGKIKSGIKKTRQLGFYQSQLVFGWVNGLLPCGLVYGALAGSFLELSAWRGALFMVFFGLGTLPMMLSVSLGAGLLKKWLGKISRLIIKLTYGLLGIWLVYRGFLFDGAHLHQQKIDGFIHACGQFLGL